MSTSISDVIDEVYAAFATTPKPRGIDCCSCCTDDELVTLLLRVPLRAIPAKQLSVYASTAFLTVADIAAYRYFLPRVLEISAADPGWWPDVELIGHSLRDAKWMTWNFREKEAITQLYHTKLEEILSESDRFGLNSWLCSMAFAGLGVDHYLSGLEADPSKVLHFYAHNADPSRGIRFANTPWSESSAGAQQVLAWFYSPSVSKLIHDSYGVDLHALRKPVS